MRSSPSATVCISAMSRIPGLPPGSARLGFDVPWSRPRRGDQRRIRAAGPSVDIAASMLSSPGYATAAFVLSRSGADITADIERVVAGVATRARPGRTSRPCSRTVPASTWSRWPASWSASDRPEHHPVGRRGPTGGDGDHRDRRRSRSGCSAGCSVKAPWWVLSGDCWGCPAASCSGRSSGSVRAIDVGGLRRHHRSALHAELDRDRSGRGDRQRNPLDDRAGRQAGPRRAAGVNGERWRGAARQDDPAVAAPRRDRNAGGRRRRARRFSSVGRCR